MAKDNDLLDFLISSANDMGVPPELALSVAKTESGLNPNAIGPQTKYGRAVGLFQLLPGTAKDLGVDPSDPYENILGGLAYLKQNYDQFGKWDLAVAAHHAGPGAIRKAGGIPNTNDGLSTTADYVKKIMDDAGKFADDSGLAPINVKETTNQAPKRDDLLDNILDRNFFQSYVPSERGSAESKQSKDSGILGTLKAGLRGTGRAIGAAIDLHQLDNDELAGAVKSQQADLSQQDESLAALKSDIQSRKERLGKDAGWLETGKELLSAMASNPKGSALLVAEQLPNSAAALGSGWAGAKVGSMAGGALGGLPGAAVGGVAGFVTGMFGANYALEGGNKALEAAANGPLSEEDRSRIIGEGATKAGVITAVDAATFGIGGKLAGTAQRAVDRAGARVLTEAGVDATDRAAVLAAIRQNPALLGAVKEAEETAFKASTTLGQRAIQGGAALGLETFGEGLGEYVGEGVATGNWDKMEAMLESFSSFGQSAAQAGYNIAKNNVSLSDISRARDIPEAIVAFNATQAQGSLTATSNLSQEADALQATIRDTDQSSMDLGARREEMFRLDPRSLVADNDFLRQLSPEDRNDLLYFNRIANSDQADELQKQQANARVNETIGTNQSLWADRTYMTAGQNAQRIGAQAPVQQEQTPTDQLKLGHQAGEPLVVFKDGSTMTRAEYEAEVARRDQARLDGMTLQNMQTPQTEAARQAALTQQQQLADEEQKLTLPRTITPEQGAQLTEVAEDALPAQVRPTAAFLKVMSRVLGKQIKWVTGAKFDGMTKDSNTIYINADGVAGQVIDKAAVFGHEFWHTVKKSHKDIWNTVKNVVDPMFDDATSLKMFRDYFAKDAAMSVMTDEQVKAWMQEERQAGETNRDFMLEEFISDLGGNRFGENDFWKDVFSQLEQREGHLKAVTMIRRFVKALTEAIDKLLTVLKMQGFKADNDITAEQLTAVKAALTKGMADYLEVTRYGTKEQVSVAGEEKMSGPKKTPGSDVGHKRTKSGEYVGAPPGMTASKLGKLRNTLRTLIEEGKDGRMWYEESSDAILASAEGDRAFAEKISGLLAIYSPNATVSGNATMGIKALYQWANGEPIKVRFPDQDRKAQAWMDGTISNDDALKIKTGNFHRNLMRKIDEENYGYDKQGATIDMWMARVFGYGSKAIGSEARYYFAERETKQLAKELGWEPQQVQAALWVAIKARVEAIRNEARDIGLKKGWVKEKIKNGNISYEPVNAESREKYEGLILKMALAADRSVTDEFIHKGVYNFATALKERVGQLSWEAMPGKTTGVLPGIFNAPLEQQAEYLAAIDAALRDENGGDLIAKKLDIPVLQTSFGPSAWQMNVGAGAQTEVVIPTDREQKSKNISVNQNAKDLLNTYAAIRGYVLAQEAVVWHYPIFDAAKKNANGVQLDFGRDPTHEEVKALYQAIYEASGRDDWAPAYVPGVGVRVLNFAEPQFDKEANEWTYLDANKVEHRAATKEELMPKAQADGVDNATFQKLVKKAAASLPEDLTIHFDTFKSDGDYIWNDWKESPNGEDYRQRISRSGRSDLQGWVESELRPRVERVNQEFSDKYGWGKVKFSLPRSDVGSTQRAGAVAAEGSGEVRSYGTAAPGAVSVQGFHYSTAERSQLDGRYYGTGTKGAEYPRVMSSRDPRIKERIYFYVDAGRGITPEQGVGSVGHTVNLNNVYDGTNDTWLQAKISRDLKGDEWMNAFESAVIDNGFDGYVSDFGTQRAAVLLGRHSVKVQPTQATNGAVAESKPAQENAGADAVAKSRVLPGGKMSGADWKRMVPAVVPGADVSMLEDGKDYYKDDVVAAMRGVKYSLGRTINIDGVDRPTQNSNGKPIAQTEEGLRRFWRWFGDSKVVDAEGRPLVVYHGTAYKFDAFDPARVGSTFEVDDNGFFFTSSESEADKWADAAEAVWRREKRAKYGDARVVPVYLALQNPWTIKADTSDETGKSPVAHFESGNGQFNRGQQNTIQYAVDSGYDGLIVRDDVVDDSHEAMLVVFDPTKIKSATGNRGTFDGSNPDIRYSTRRAINGEFDANAFIAPDIEPWLSNKQLVDLAFVDGKPIRLNVGYDNGPGSGKGAVHLVANAERGNGRRNLDQVTDDDGENVVRTVLNALAKQGASLHKDKNGSYALRVILANKSLILADQGDHYNIITMLPSAKNKWGDAEWVGRLTFPTTTDATSAEPLSMTSAESSLADQGGQGTYVSTKFDLKAPYGLNQPTSGMVVRQAAAVTQKKRRTPDAEAMKADGLKLSPSRRLIGDSGRQYDAAQRQMFKNVGRDIEYKNIFERTKDYLTKDFAKKMATGIVDQFRGLRDLGDGGQAYMLARLSKGTAGAFDALLHHGKLSIKDGAYDADLSGGFVDRLGKPLNGELDDVLWWIASNRAEKLSKQDRENLFTDQDIAAGKSLASGTTDWDYTIQTGPAKGKVTRDRTLIYADANRVFNEFQKNTLDMAEQSGLIDGASRQFWESEFYVPFYRVSEEDGEFIGTKMGNQLVRQSAFKKLKGGTDKLNSDLLSNTLLNMSHLIDAAAKNRAAKAALEAAENVGAAHKAQPGDKKTVWFAENGQKVEYKVTDPFVMTAITSLEYAGMRNPIMDALSKFKHWLTIGVTASPAFKVRNLIRDSVQAIGTSDLGYNPITNVVTGFKQTKRDSQEYVSALASGALIRFGTMLEGNESARTRQLIKQGVKNQHILDSEPKWQQFYDKVVEPMWSAYQEIGNRSEEINRAALYNQLIKKGVSHAEAALMARDLMDFSMQGSFNTIRFLSQVVPFLNARLQGMYKLGRSAKDNPRKMAVVTGAVAMASIALMLAYDDDEDWKRREDWDRDGFWWFKFGGIEYRIPKPFEIGAVATLAERSLEYMINDEMTGDRFRKVTKDLVMNNLSMNPVPQMIKPIIDLYANKDSFTGRPIENMSMQRLDPTMRYNSSTSMTARAASQATMGALSPVQIDHLVRGYFGWLGGFVNGGADMAWRSMSNEPTKPALDYWKFATQGILKEQGTGSSRYVTMVYDQAKELEEAHATYRQLKKDGKLEEAQEYAEDNADKLSRYRQVETVKKQESKLNERIRIIERSNIQADEKKDLIAAIQKQKEDVAKRIAPGLQ